MKSIVSMLCFVVLATATGTVLVRAQTEKDSSIVSISDSTQTVSISDTTATASNSDRGDETNSGAGADGIMRYLLPVLVTIAVGAATFFLYIVRSS